MAFETTDGSADDISETPLKFILPMALLLFILVAVPLILVKIDSEAQINKHNNFVDGIRRATSAYSQRYSMSTENLKALSEGYLTKEDLDTSIYNINTNPVNVDSVLASKYYYEILSGNTGLSEATLKTFNLNLVHVYTVYNYDSSTNIIKMKYITKIFKPNGTATGEKICNTLLEVENFVETTLKVDVDISDSIDKSVHKEQEYSRDNEFRSGTKTVSTFNTYMSIGVKIPLKGRFLTSDTDFFEIQTYSTGRLGEN